MSSSTEQWIAKKWDTPELDPAHAMSAALGEHPLCLAIAEKNGQSRKQQRWYFYALCAVCAWHYIQRLLRSNVVILIDSLSSVGGRLLSPPDNSLLQPGNLRD